MIEVTFNGVKLSDYIRVTEVIRPIGNNRELTLSENLSIGATVTKTRRGIKEHVIKFDIDTKDAREREELKHVLAGIFDVEKPELVSTAVMSFIPLSPSMNSVFNQLLNISEL